MPPDHRYSLYSGGQTAAVDQQGVFQTANGQDIDQQQSAAQHDMSDGNNAADAQTAISGRQQPTAHAQQQMLHSQHDSGRLSSLRGGRSRPRLSSVRFAEEPDSQAGVHQYDVPFVNSSQTIHTDTDVEPGSGV